MLAPDGVATPDEAGTFRLPADPDGYARGLYATLREIDGQGYDVIVAAAPEAVGVGTAVWDRLRRAAAPRSGS